MKKIGIFYGSATGTTEAVARKLGAMMGVDADDIHNVAKCRPSDVAKYDVLILGTSTWGAGDVEEDWYDMLDGMDALDLEGKTVALFGCGDETMTDTFCDGVGDIYERLKDTGARFIGEFDTDGYSFNHSSAVVQGKAVGLLLDQVNHPEMTPLRMRQWVGEVMDASDK